MIPELGQISLILALLLAALLATLPAIGAWKGNDRLIALAPSLATGVFVFIALAFGLLGWAFWHHDFSVVYVANNSNLLLPWYYRLSAIWGGHEGSLLLWMLMLSGWTVAVAFLSNSLPRDFRARVLAVMGFVAVGFLLFTILTSNPFERVLPGPPDGRDLNPLLQDPGMIFHPPLLYMGYVGFAVAFGFAVAGLLSGNIQKQWVRWSRPWTLAAWGFLTVGITLGSWWAYYELGWGGWWFWDPVENASFMPWLVGTALIHSQAVTEKRGAMPAWTVLLAIAAFSFSLLGTFLVRSGVLTSVHAFANDPERGLFILGFLSVVTGGSLLLYALRAPRIMTGGGFDWFSRETLLLLNNVFFTVSAAMVLLGTLYPLITDAMGWGQISVGPPYFSAMFLLLMTPVVVLLPLAPFTRWKKDQPGRALRPLVIAAVAALILSLALCALLGTWDARAFFGCLGGTWLVLGALAYLARRMRDGGRLPRHVIGMTLAHLGAGVFVIGAAMVASGTVERDVRMAPGDSVELGAYRFELEQFSVVEGANWRADQATLNIYKGERKLTEMTPQKRRYARSGQVMTQVALNQGITRDLYVAMGEPLDGGQAWSLRLHIKPFVRWIWGGAVLIALGAAVSATDRRYHRNRARAGQPAASETATAGA